MGKLELIKAKLASLLIEVKFESIKTDKAILEIEGELAEGKDVFVVDAETEEKVAAADGEYITEDNKVITVEGGKIVSIVEKKEEEEPVEEPAEEPKKEENIEAAEEPKDEEPAEEPKEDEPAEEPKNEEPKEEEKDEVAELKKRVDEMEKIIEELVSKLEGFKEETLSKLKMSAAAPAEEEFENIRTRKTGDTKLDRFLERYGK